MNQYGNARQYIGKHVCVTDTYGRKHYGVVRDVTPNGVSVVRYGHTQNIFIPWLFITGLALLTIPFWGWGFW